MHNIVQDAGVAAHLEFNKVLHESLVQSNKEIEEQMLAEARGLLKCLIELHKQHHGRRTTDVQVQIVQMFTQYITNFQAIKICYCTIEEVYTQACITEDDCFQARFGAGAVTKASEQKTQIIQQHSEAVASLRRRRDNVEATAERLANSFKT